MKRNIFFILSVLSAGLLTASSANFSPVQKQEIKKIVQEMLLQNPQIVEDALNKLVEKKETEKVSALQKKVKTYETELFYNKAAPFIGNPNGKKILTVFTDPLCGYCQRLDNLLKNAVAENKELKVIFLLLPILGKVSQRIAAEEIAAYAQGQFAAFHHEIYRYPHPKIEQRLKVVETLGMDMKKFKTDALADSVMQQIERNQVIATELMIEGTPALVLPSGQIIYGAVEKAELQELIK